MSESPTPVTSPASVTYMVQDGSVARKPDGQLQQVPSAAKTLAKKSALTAKISQQAAEIKAPKGEIDAVRNKVQQLFGGSSLFDLLRKLKTDGENAGKEQAQQDVETADLAAKEIALEGKKALKATEDRLTTVLQEQLTAVEGKQTHLMAAILSGVPDRQRLMGYQALDARQKKAMDGQMGGALEALEEFLDDDEDLDIGASREREWALARLDGNEARNTPSLEQNAETLMRDLTFAGLDAGKVLKELMGIKDEAQRKQRLSELLGGNDGEKARLKSRVDQQQKKAEGIATGIAALVGQIDALKKSSTARKSTLDALQKQLAERSDLLQKAAEEWKTLQGLVSRIEGTRSAVQNLQQEVHQALTPYQVLELEEALFAAMADKLQRLNGTCCDMIAELYENAAADKMGSKNLILKSMKTLGKDQNFLPADLAEQESLFQAALAARKARTIDITQLKKNPEQTISAFFQAEKGSSDFTQLIKTGLGLVRTVAEAARAVLDEDLAQVITVAQSEHEGIWKQANARIKRAIKPQLQWFEKQLEKARQSGKMGTPKKQFSSEQEAELVAALAGIDDVAIEDALFPLLAVFLNEQEMKTLASYNEGKTPVLKIDSVGPTEKSYRFSRKALSPEPTAKQQLLINDKPAHMALFDQKNGLLVQIRALLASIESNEVVKAEWTFVVEAA